MSRNEQDKWDAGELDYKSERDTPNPYVSDDDVELDPATAAQYERDRREDDTPKAPDFDLINQGSICLLTPRTPAAKDWIEEHLPNNATLWGPSIVVEPRYVQAIIDGVEAEGLTVELF